MSDEITRAKATDLKPDLANANRHTERGVGMVHGSIEVDGFRFAGTLDKNNYIVHGNNRHEQATDIGLEDVVILDADPTKQYYLRFNDLDLTDPDNRARILAYQANRSAQVSIDFDPERVLADLNAGVDLGRFWNEGEFAAILAELGHGNGKEPEAPPVDKAAALQEKWGTRLGQVWSLGEHRLAVGDCTDKAVVEAVMRGERARYGMHDPPYGIDVVIASDSGGDKPFGVSTGSIGFHNTVKTNAYRPVIGDDKPFHPGHLLELSDDQILWGANYYADKLPPQKGWIVWDKKGRENWRDNFSDCELAWSSLPIVTRIFRHTWMGMVQEGQREERVHPTQKPSMLFVKIIDELFKNDGIIIDFYLGSGTTLIACEQLSRKCRGIEIDPGYAAVSLQRWADLTGKEPTLLSDQ